MTNAEYLRLAENRLKILQMYNPDSAEVIRFRDVIIPDLKSKVG